VDKLAQISEFNSAPTECDNTRPGLATDIQGGTVDDRFHKYHESARPPALACGLHPQHKETQLCL